MHAVGEVIRNPEQGPEKDWCAPQDITERRQAEDAVRASEQRLGLALVSANMGMWEWDLAERQLRISPEHQRLFGLPEAITECSLDDYLQLIRPADRETIAAMFQDCAQSGTRFDVEYPIRRANDGADRWIHSTGNTVLKADGRKHFMGVSRDITERRNAELALSSTEKFLRKVLNSSLAGIYIHDLALGIPIFANQQHTALTGFAPEDCKSMSREEFAALFHPEDAPKVAEHMEHLKRANDGEVLEIEYRSRTAAGRWIWALSRHAVFTRNSDGSVKQLIGSFLDITARKEAEARLQERERELSRVLETAVVGLARCTRDFRCVWANAPLSRLLGVPLGQVIGVPMADVVGEEGFGRIRPFLERTLLGERVEHEIEMRLPGGMRWIYAVNTPDVDCDGKISGFFVSLADLTKQKSLEREVQRSSENEQRRICGELHEGICQELMAVAFTARALQRRLEKQSNPLAATMEELTKGISRTMTHTRELAHGINPVVSDADGLEHALRELASATAERHQVGCQFECSLPVSINDPLVNTQLLRIAREAVDNAVKHSQGTRIDLALRETESEIILFVIDNGCGLPANADSGSGFGLRSMRYRAGLIHGSLIVQDRKGGGTEIICRVPRSPENKGSNR